MLSLSANVPAVGTREEVWLLSGDLAGREVIQGCGGGTEERGLRLRGQRRRGEGRGIEEAFIVMVGVWGCQDVTWKPGGAGDQVGRGLRIRQGGGTLELHVIAGRVLNRMLVKFPSQGCDGQALVVVVIVVVEGNGGGGLLRAEVGGSGPGKAPGETLRCGRPRRWTSRGEWRDESAVTIDHESVIPFQSRARRPGGRGGREGEVFEHGGAISDFTKSDRAICLCGPLDV